METYRLALFLHLLALLVAIAASALGHFAERRMLSAATLPELHQWTRMLARIQPIFPIALITLVATGAYMVHRGFTWDTGWIDAGLAGAALLFASGAGLIGPRLRTLLRALDRGGNPPTDLLRDPVARLTSWLDTGLALSVVFVMTVQPSDLGSIAALVVGAAAGATVGAALLRRTDTRGLRPGLSD